MRTLTQVDKGGWLRAVDGIKEFYNSFGEKLPKELRNQNSRLKERIEAMQPKRVHELKPAVSVGKRLTGMQIINSGNSWQTGSNILAHDHHIEQVSIPEGKVIL